MPRLRVRPGAACIFLLPSGAAPGCVFSPWAEDPRSLRFTRCSRIPRIPPCPRHAGAARPPRRPPVSSPYLRPPKVVRSSTLPSWLAVPPRFVWLHRAAVGNLAGCVPRVLTVFKPILGYGPPASACSVAFSSRLRSLGVLQSEPLPERRHMTSAASPPRTRPAALLQDEIRLV